jgi:hypothetical protein
LLHSAAFATRKVCPAHAHALFGIGILAVSMKEHDA